MGDRVDDVLLHFFAILIVVGVIGFLLDISTAAYNREYIMDYSFEFIVFFGFVFLVGEIIYWVIGTSDTEKSIKKNGLVGHILEEKFISFIAAWILFFVCRGFIYLCQFGWFWFNHFGAEKVFEGVLILLGVCIVLFVWYKLNELKYTKFKKEGK
jgi:hypothetical protein